MTSKTAVLLAGGRGTRLSELTSSVPKPMVQVGKLPILWHIMKQFDHFGVKNFIICTGYKSTLIKDFFLNYRLHTADLRIDLQAESVKVLTQAKEDWVITIIDTGDDSNTGGRLRRIQDLVSHERHFFVTYGDGLADVDLKALEEFHSQREQAVTVTAVQSPGRFGSLVIQDGQVRTFSEKPQGEGGWINGGFFVMRPAALEVIKDDSTSWEYESIPTLVKNGQINAFEHAGFWHPMDTLRDHDELNRLWESGSAPWKMWA